MEQPRAFWRYALGIGLAMLLASQAAMILRLWGPSLLVVTAAAAAGAAYLMTPAAQRRDHKRIAGLALVAIVAAMIARQASVIVWVSAIVAGAAFGPPQNDLNPLAVTMIAVSYALTLVIYLGLFRLGWGALMRRPTPAA